MAVRSYRCEFLETRIDGCRMDTGGRNCASLAYELFFRERPAGEIELQGDRFMVTTLRVRDESANGDALHEFALEVLTERITVRELIRSRVYQEVQDYNRRQPEVFQGLVQPTDAERTLNGFHMKKQRTIDWQKQFDKAIEAFEANRI